jgi:hypothetical protein
MLFNIIILITFTFQTEVFPSNFETKNLNTFPTNILLFLPSSNFYSTMQGCIKDDDI